MSDEDSLKDEIRRFRGEVGRLADGVASIGESLYLLIRAQNPFKEEEYVGDPPPISKMCFRSKDLPDVGASVNVCGDLMSATRHADLSREAELQFLHGGATMVVFANRDTWMSCREQEPFGTNLAFVGLQVAKCEIRGKKLLWRRGVSKVAKCVVEFV